MNSADSHARFALATYGRDTRAAVAILPLYKAYAMSSTTRRRRSLRADESSRAAES
jgi:hypothetical protein